MTSSEGKTHRWRDSMAAVTVAVLLLLAVYISAYALLVTVDDGPSAPDFIMGEAAARYRFGGRPAEVFFTPVHAIDRRLRPQVWTFEPPMVQPLPP